MKRFSLAIAGALLIATFAFWSPQARAFAAWQLPLARPVLVHQYLQPASDFSAGHRGVDLLAQPDQEVLAAAEGEVSFVGTVVSRQIVSIAHSGSLKTSYEPVCASVAKGQKVVRGEPIGKICAGADYQSHCGVRLCLHFSLRKAQGYLSPLAQIGLLSPSRLIQARG